MGILSGIGGVLSGLLSPGAPSLNLSQLFNTIQNAGQYQQQLINQLPTNLQQQYQQYIQSNQGAINTLQTGTTALGNDFLSQISNVYGPNSPAAQAQTAALKQQVYAGVPQQTQAVSEALAATGGFNRGAATRALSQVPLQAATQVSQGIANIAATQTAAQQNATAQAINKVLGMNDQVLQQQFGLSQQQALNLLQYGRQDQINQLTELINQSNTETNQLLGVEGAGATNQFNQQVANNAQQQGIINGLIGVGTGALGAGYNALGGWQGISTALGGGNGVSPYANPTAIPSNNYQPPNLNLTNPTQGYAGYTGPVAIPL
jgi:hypothetical protein